MAYIKEIFESIQGEGLYIGEKQIFVRFCSCNLNCAYCDTDFKTNKKEFLVDELFYEIKKYTANRISFTGGEPLADVQFIKSFLLKYKNDLNKKIHLETNGTMPLRLKEIIDLVDVVSMDIKIKSSTFEENKFDINDEFLKVAGKKAFIKVVFDNNIKDEEINEICALAKKHSSPLVIQPKSPISKDIPFLKIYNKFFEKYQNTRLIPQIHPFLGVD